MNETCMAHHTGSQCLNSQVITSEKPFDFSVLSNLPEALQDDMFNAVKIFL